MCQSERERGQEDENENERIEQLKNQINALSISLKTYKDQFEAANANQLKWKSKYMEVSNDSMSSSSKFNLYWTIITVRD